MEPATASTASPMVIVGDCAIRDGDYFHSISVIKASRVSTVNFVLVPQYKTSFIVLLHGENPLISLAEFEGLDDARKMALDISQRLGMVQLADFLYVRPCAVAVAMPMYVAGGKFNVKVALKLPSGSLQTAVFSLDGTRAKASEFVAKIMAKINGDSPANDPVPELCFSHFEDT